MGRSSNSSRPPGSKAHHVHLDEGVYFRRVFTFEKGSYPNVQLANLSVSCMHCGSPCCEDVCPTRALHAGPLDEITSLAAKKSAQRLNQKTLPSLFI